MAATIKIHRSGSAASPTALAQGEMAYSWLSGAWDSGGQRLYIGTGTETDGEAANIEVIGGKYFTDLLDHQPGVATANSALILDANKKADTYLTGSGSFANTTISTTVGNLVLAPTSNIDVSSKKIINLATPTANTDAVTKLYVDNLVTSGFANSELSIQSDTGANTVNLQTQSLIIAGGTGISGVLANTTITLSLDNTAVTPGSYGSTTAIPTFTVDSQGRLTAAGSVNISTTLDIVGDSGTDSVSLLTDTLTFEGGTGVLTVVSNNNIAFSIGQDVSTTSDVVFNDGTFAGDLIVSGDLTVGGNTTYINASVLEVEDPLIKLAKGNTSDAVDIGFYGLYNNGISDIRTGFFRSAITKDYYLFDSLSTDIVSNAIDLGSVLLADMHLNDLNANNLIVDLDITANNLSGTIDGGTY